MRLYLVRHAIAVLRNAADAMDDASRPLAPDGMKKARKHARALHDLGVELDEIWSSPLVRAWQTAEILAGEFGLATRIRPVDGLAPPGDPHALSGELRSICTSRRGVALVGHEPFMGEYATRLLFDDSSDAIVFKKGGAACLEVEVFEHGLRGRLLWLLTPKQLRMMAP